MVLVCAPYCGLKTCAENGTSILGVFVFSLWSDDWDSLFPKHVEVYEGVGGARIKSADDVRKYSTFVDIHEPFFDLNLRCHYAETEVTNMLRSFLWLAAIFLLASGAVLIVLNSSSVRSHHHHERVEWAVRQMRILNLTTDIIASVSNDAVGGAPQLRVINPGGDHELNGTPATAVLELSSLVESADDAARVGSLLSNTRCSFSDGHGRNKVEMPKTFEFASKFVDGASGRSIPFEVCASALSRHDEESRERICVFRNVLSRTLRVEESIRAAKAEERLGENEKTAKYVEHEIKNRLIILVDILASCDALQRHDAVAGDLRAKHAAMSAIATELLETTTQKSVLLQLATDRYQARLVDTRLEEIVSKRVSRYADAGRRIRSGPTMGSAAKRETLILDPVLVNIIIDNLFSNALKYGAAEPPPSVELRVDGAEDAGSKSACVTLTVRNAAGPGHARLLALGDTGLNRVAASQGERAHGDHGANESAGDGFPMAVSSAHALGGTLLLSLSETHVTAELSIPFVAYDTFARWSATRIADLSVALVDDSSIQRRMFSRKLARLFASPSASSPSSSSASSSKKESKEEPSSADAAAEQLAAAARVAVLAGETQASVESFPQCAVDSDADVVLIDQHFGQAHATKLGTDLVREIRAIDAHHDHPPRLIFVISADDSPDDVLRYQAAGADGHVSKTVSIEQLRAQICQPAVLMPRFNTRITHDPSAKTDSSQRRS